MSGENYKNSLEKVPFEVALDEAGYGLYSHLLTVLTGLSIISYVFVIYSSTIIVPTSACELQTTSAQQGLLVAGPLVGTVIGSAIWGYLADKYGRRSMLLVSFLAAAAINGVASISVSWIMLLLLQFLVAVLAAGQYSIPMTLLSECVPMARRNLVVLIVASIFLLSQGIMAVVAIPIISLEFSYYLPSLDIYWNPWRTVLLIYSLPSLICLLWMYFMQESPKFVFSKGSEEEALRILTLMHRMNCNKNSTEYQASALTQHDINNFLRGVTGILHYCQNPKSKSPSQNELCIFQVKGLLAENSDEDKKSSKSSLELFKAPYLKYFVIVTVLFALQQSSAFKVWLPTIANQFVEIIQSGEGADFTLCEILGASQNTPPNPDLPPCALNEIALLIVLGVSCLTSLSNIIISQVLPCTGRRNMVIVLAAVFGLSGIVVNLVPNAYGSAFFFILFLNGMLLLGLYTAIAVALFPTHLRALAVSLTMAGGRIMLFAAIQILNYLLETNCELGFYIFASVLAVSALISSFLPDDRYLKKSQSVEHRGDI
ncbi:synaptic vesicle 2-related protein-like [Pectinophora gossypiella]|nr:synaptic vesicle 2-related protein-like [Pectinophora gossypiella]